METREWEFENCAVYEEESDYDLHNFVVVGLVTGCSCTVAPGCIIDASSIASALDAGENPIDCGWEDGAGNLVKDVLRREAKAKGYKVEKGCY